MSGRTSNRVPPSLRVLVLASLLTTGARAEEASGAREVPGRWGYWVVASSVVAGGSVTSYGLTLDCRRGDDSCRWNTGLTIWGGVGMATFGSMLGLAIVHDGRRRVRLAAGASGAGTALFGAAGEF